MESLESLLRDEFDPPTIRPRGDVSELIATTRRLRRRRTAGTVTMVLGLVLALVVSVVVTQSVLAGRDRAANPDPAPPSVDLELRRSLLVQFLNTAGVPRQGGFIDADHGYLMLGVCPTPSDENCHVRLLATEDGGATLAERPVPPMDRLNLSTSSLWVFGPDALVFEARQTASFPLQRWASADGGLTWQEAPVAPVGPIAHIPVGAKLVDSSGGNTIVLAADGTAYTLSTMPAGTRFQVNGPWLPNTYEGAHFVESAAGDLFVSLDRGASWQPVTTRNIRVFGGAGDHVYAVLSAIGDGSFGLAPTPPDLYVSDDRGRTWHTVSWPELTPIEGFDRTAYGGDDVRRITLAVLPGGGVLLADGARVWRLEAGGDAFEPVGGGQTHLVLGIDGFVMGLRGGATDAAFSLTADGEDWRRLDLS